MDQSSVGFRSWTSAFRFEAAAPKIAVKDPDPTKFVPVFDWDLENIWVFVKKPGSVPEGPVQIPHTKIHSYAGKLGWLSQKILLVGKIDPSTYGGPADIYPLDWALGDVHPAKPPTTADAQNVVFEPVAKSNAEFQVAATMQSTSVDPEAPESLPADPGEFSIQSNKDPHGHSLVKHKGTGALFSMLPGGKVAQWSAVEAKYYVHVKGEDGWTIDFDHPLLTPDDVVKLPPTVPEGFVLPSGYTATTVTPAFVLAKTLTGAAVKYDLQKKAWFKMDAPWEEHIVEVPPTEQPAATPVATMGTGSGPVKSGVAPPVVVPVSAEAPKEEPPATTFTLASDPEGLPKGLKFAGKVDANGLPMVDEDFGLEDDPDYGEKGLTLLPDDRVGRWLSGSQVYRLYVYHDSDGYVPLKKGLTGISFADVEQILVKLRLVVKDGRYFKKIEAKSTKINEPGVPKGFVSMSPTDMEVGQGLVPLKHVETAKKYYLLPGNLVATSDSEEGPYAVFSVGASGLVATADKALTLLQIVWMTKGLSYKSPAHTVLLSQADKNGYPLVTTAPLDPDNDPSVLTLLSSGEVAEWQKAGKQYHVWVWEKSDGDYFPSHPPKYYTLKQLAAMKPKKMAGSPAPVKSIKMSVPTVVLPPVEMPATPVVVPPPEVVPPEPEVVSKAGGKAPVHTEFSGDKDSRGFPLLQIPGMDMAYVALPIPKGEEDLTVGQWFESYKAYRVMEWDEGQDYYVYYGSGKDTAWYALQDNEWVLHIGVIPLGGLKATPEPEKPVEPSKAPEHTKFTGKTDARGLPELVATEWEAGDAIFAHIPVDTGVGYWLENAQGTGVGAYRVQEWSVAHGYYLQKFIATATNDFEPLWWRLGDTTITTGAELKAAEVAKAPEVVKAPEVPSVVTPPGFIAPAGYSVISATPTEVVATTSAGEKVLWIKSIDSWWSLDEPGKEHRLPPEAATSVLGVAAVPVQDLHGLESLDALDVNGFPKLKDPKTGTIYSKIPFGSGVGVWIKSKSLYGCYEFVGDEWSFVVDPETNLGTLWDPKTNSVESLSIFDWDTEAEEAEKVELPEGAEYTGEKNQHGFPVVVAANPSQHLDFALLPTGRFGRWRSEYGLYRIYDWSVAEKIFNSAWTDYGPIWWVVGDSEVTIGSSEEVIAAQALKKAQEVEPLGPVPVGMAFTGAKDEHGFPLVKEKSTGFVYSLLPTGEIGDFLASKVYRIREYGAEYNLYVTKYIDGKGVWWIPGAPDVFIGSYEQAVASIGTTPSSIGVAPVVAASVSVSGTAPAHTTLTGHTDVNGCAVLQDAEDFFYSYIPVAEGVGRWDEDAEAYRVFTWKDSGGGNTYYAPDFKEGYPVWWVPGAQQVYVGNDPPAVVPGEEAPEPSVTSATPPQASDVPAGMHLIADYDAKGLQYMEDAEGWDAVRFSFIPVDTRMGAWQVDKKGYKVMEVVAEGKGAIKGASMEFDQKKIKGKKVWWIYGEPTVYVGMLKKGGKKKAVPLVPEVEAVQDDSGWIDVTGVDVNGLPSGPGAYHGAGASQKFSKIPVDSHVGWWNASKSAYVVYAYDENAVDFKVRLIGGEYVWWVFGSPTVHVGNVVVGAAPAFFVPSSTQPQSSLIGSLGSEIPDVSKLKILGDGGALGYPGAGKKDIYIDPKTNTRYIFKPAYVKGSQKLEPFRAYVQEACSALTLKLRPDHIPVKSIKVNGVLGTIQPEVALAEFPTLKGSSLTPSTMTDEQRNQITTDHVVDWVMSQHDTHSENMIVTDDGRILSIDKEQGFRFFPNDKLAIDYAPNPDEAYYNKFWREFSEDGFAYDPRPALKTAFDKLQEVPTSEYVAMLRPYAESVFPGNVPKQRVFLKRALARKLNARADFEKFLTGLYTTRKGEQGFFDLDKGWVSESTTHVTVTVPISSLMGPEGVYSRDYGYKDAGTQVTQTDPTKVVLKIKNYQGSVAKQKLIDFVQQVGLTPLPFPDGTLVVNGVESFSMCVSRAAYNEATVETEVPIEGGFLSTPPQPVAWAGVDTIDEPAIPNLEVLNTKPSKMTIGVGGIRVTFDGGKVEGLNGKGRKYKDEQGEYLQFQFKLRRGTWIAVDEYFKDHHVGTVTDFKWSEGTPDVDGTVNLTGGSAISSAAAFDAVRLDVTGDVVYVARISSSAELFDPATYAGLVVVQIRNSNSNALEVLKSLLNKVKPGLSEELFKKPTPEDDLRRKYFRAIWAFGGKAADSLAVDTPTATLKQKAEQLCTSVGHDISALDRIEDQEVFPGYHTHVLPGRRKVLAKGKAWFAMQAFKEESVVGVLTHGVLGIHQRNQLGMAKFGMSYESDSRNGCGDNFCARLITEPMGTLGVTHWSYGDYIAIFHPEVLDRLDTYIHEGDKYGTCSSIGSNSGAWSQRKGLERDLDAIGLDTEVSTHEICFRQGIPRSRILRIVTAYETHRKTAILRARAEGITKVGAVPVDQFVVVCGNFKEVWEKYVKPVVVD